MDRMSGRNLALAGIPRGGTTLACRLLGQAPGAIALFEPMPVHQLPAGDMAGAVAEVARFFAASRTSLLADGTAPSKLHGGEVPDNPFSSARSASGERKLQATLGTLRVQPPAQGFTLVVKHNAAFLALLPALSERFEAFAIVRNPLAVLASWNSVQLPVREGRLPAGERLDPDLARCLDAEPDRVARQLLVLDWCFARIATLPHANVLRYEAVAASGGQALFDATGLQGTSDATLEARNANPAWQATDPRGLAARLLAHGGAWRGWYDDREIHALAGGIEGAREPGATR